MVLKMDRRIEMLRLEQDIFDTFLIRPVMALVNILICSEMIGRFSKVHSPIAIFLVKMKNAFESFNERPGPFNYERTIFDEESLFEILSREFVRICKLPNERSNKSG